MKKLLILNLLVLLGLLVYSTKSLAQNPVNWTEKQLEEPAALAQAISSKSNVPVIINVGPDAIIPGSVNVGPVDNSKGLRKFRAELKSINKDEKIVIYCGCCPFEQCPNVRPAIAVLKEKGFRNYYLLNLPYNIRKDWIDKGYPVR